MSFFKDFKEDLSQAVNELIDEDAEQTLDAETSDGKDMVVNTLEGELDVKSELAKLDGLLEKAADIHSAAPVVKEEKVDPVPAGPTAEEIMEFMKNKETKVEEEAAMSAEENLTVNTMEEQVVPKRSTLSDEVSEETTIITAGTKLKGNLESTGSMDIRGSIDGNVTCNGKMTVTGMIKGNSSSAEFFADAAKIEGEVSSTGTVKVGLGSVVIGNISAASAVIAGAIKGDIDVQGPVVVDTSAVIMGNIKSRSVQINNGAVIEGFCSQSYAEVDLDSLFQE